MLNCVRRLAVIVAAIGSVAASFSLSAATPIEYRFSFPEPEHRWMQVEAAFSGLDDTPLHLRINRSSPGRYSLHEFAKNVWDVHAFAADGGELPTTRPDPYGWDVTPRGGRVTVKYKVYGDRADGTYLAVDTTHAHINMPAVIMWARSLDDRPAKITFEPPAGLRWRVASQLHPGASPFEFTAPNLQYLMDSPAEFGPLVVRQFSVGSRTFRFAVHHAGTDAELDAFVKDVEKIVAQEGAIYGEFPSYEPGVYTFLADYLPYVDGDGMEHRNSTVMTSAGAIRNPAERIGLLDTVAHEFFHGWNVERIRPRSLEPFDFERANMSSELWLAEGFTQYYGPLVLQRAGLTTLDATAATFAGNIEAATLEPGRLVRSAEDMSRMAAFIDGGRPIDRTNWANTVISYYPFGAAIGLALDLELRDRSDGQVSLDDFMRAMWRVHGRPGGAREGYVDRPYTTADAEARLAEVSGDRAFARDFFARFIEGREVADYRRLLMRAGLVLRRRSAGRSWWGDLRLEAGNGTVRIAAVVPSNSPAYAAGMDQDDEIRRIDGRRIGSVEELNVVFSRHKPGDRLDVVIADRSGAERTASVLLADDPHLALTPVEPIGGALTAAQRTFRERWLGPRALSSAPPVPSR
jgi:predicted metalloprotease with PDZ domain